MRSKNDSPPDNSSSFEFEQSDARIPLTWVVRTLSEYRWAILISMAVILIVFGVAASLYYLTRPTQQMAYMNFTVQFSRADQGQYPNGTEFSSSDIVASPILQKVYGDNSLDKYVGFPEFSSSLFIVESNERLNALAREYQAKFADPKLSPVDRDRLEAEYRLKRDSLGRSQFSLNMLLTENTKNIPKIVVNKTLQQILEEWSYEAFHSRGAARYRLPVLTKNIFSRRELLADEPIVALDVIRVKINEIVRNLRQLQDVPGAEVLRTGENQVSLAELDVQLNDLVRLRLLPLTARVRSSFSFPGSENTSRFLEAQLLHNQLRHSAARSRVESMQQALRTYAGESATSQLSQPAGTTSSDGVVPQLSESFLDRLLDLSSQRLDQEYRQQLVDEIKSASIGMIPFEAEIAYYEDLLAAARRSNGPASTGPEAMEQFRAEMQQILDEALLILRDLNGIYSLIGETTNTPDKLYAVTSPVVFQIERTEILRNIAILGIVTMLLSLPIVAVLCLLHKRLKEETAGRNGAVETAEIAPELEAANRPDGSSLSRADLAT